MSNNLRITELEKALTEISQSIAEVIDYNSQVEKRYDNEIEAITSKQRDLHEAKLVAFHQAQADYAYHLKKFKKQVKAMLAFIVLLVIGLGVFVCLKK